MSQRRLGDVPDATNKAATVVSTTSAVPNRVKVLIGTSHHIGGFEFGRIVAHFGAAANGERPFDILFVDEAWQLPLHRFTVVQRLAPIAVGVGDAADRDRGLRWEWNGSGMNFTAQASSVYVADGLTPGHYTAQSAYYAECLGTPNNSTSFSYRTIAVLPF